METFKILSSITKFFPKNCKSPLKFFFLIIWLSIIQEGKVLIFFEKEISVSLAYTFWGVVMYFFYLINWNYECPFERLGNLIISKILCSTFSWVYIYCLFYFCIKFFGTTEFHLILRVTLFQCFQEWVIRFIVKVYLLFSIFCQLHWFIADSLC